MRFKKKYKGLAHLQTLLNSLPNRVHKFKRPKWLKLKQSLIKSSVKKTYFQRFSITRLEYKNWEKINTNFKNGINLKRSLSALYDFSVPVRSFKKYSELPFLKKNSVFAYLYPLFQIDILLVKVNFISSVYEARQALKSKEIIVNGKNVSSSYNTKIGDIIEYNQRNVNLVNLFKKGIPEYFFFFFEIDYYSKTIIVIKDLSSLSILDLQNFSIEYTNFKPVTDYLKSV
jgi:ribosomal protein S4